MINTDLNEIKRQNLVRLMKERRLKSVELARMIGREPPYIAAILKPTGEKGSRNIGPKIMKIVCERLEVGESEFYKGWGFPCLKSIRVPYPSSHGFTQASSANASICGLPASPV